MHTQRKWFFSGLGLLVLALVLVVGVALLAQLPAWRLDLTADQLYTLSPGSRNIVREQAQPLTLQYYFSTAAAEELPQLRSYAQRVEELLQEYALAGGDRVTLEVIHPEPFSEAEEAAAEAGLEAVPPSPGADPIFFGLVVSRDDGMDQVIPFFHPDRQRFLEYDITQAIYRAGNPAPPVIGLMTELPVRGGISVGARGPEQDWVAFSQLEQLFELTTVDSDAALIPEAVEVLLVVHPTLLPERTLYAIDQFVLRGGKALIFLDPHAETVGGHSHMLMHSDAEQSSTLEPLLSTWGLDYDPGFVLGDSEWAMRLPTPNQGPALPHLGILGVFNGGIDRQDIITSDLEVINLASSGYFQVRDDAPAQISGLLTSSDQAMPFDLTTYREARDHRQLLQVFAPTGERYLLAARVQGEVPSAYPEGPPPLPENADDATDGDAPSAEEHLSQSTAPANVIVVGDTDMLTDRLWVQVQHFFGRSIAAPWANNGDFLINALDNLTGSADLISVRSRGQYSRPFTVVDELERAAAEDFRQQEQVLQQALEETERKISALSRDDQGQLILELTPQQQAELDRFETEKMRIRKELRQVQHQLNQEIDQLERRLKWLNILAVPLALTVLALALAAWRARRRRRHHAG